MGIGGQLDKLNRKLPHLLVCLGKPPGIKRLTSGPSALHRRPNGSLSTLLNQRRLLIQKLDFSQTGLLQQVRMLKYGKCSTRFLKLVFPFFDIQQGSLDIERALEDVEFLNPLL